MYTLYSPCSNKLTAYRYLLVKASGPFIDRLSAHLNIALACTTYQSFSCFAKKIAKQQAACYVMNGDLRLFKYVQSSWTTHLLAACALSQNTAQLRPLSDALQRLFSIHLVRRGPLRDGVASGNHSSVLSGEEEVGLGKLPVRMQIAVKKIVEYSRALEERTATGMMTNRLPNTANGITKFRQFWFQDVRNGLKIMTPWTLQNTVECFGSYSKISLKA